MRKARVLAALLFIGIASSHVLTQVQPAPAGPTFDVVSVKRNTSNALNSNVSQRPDGGLTVTNVPVSTLIARAYLGTVPADLVGLPGWATTERYDVMATTTLPSATPEQRAAMLRVMLADRFKLAVHFEKREQPVYDMVVARSDGRLGPAIKPSEGDCIAKAAADRATVEATGKPVPPPPGVFDFNAPPPPCSLRMNGPLMEGDVTMETLTRMLRSAAGRLIVDKTGLAGSYRIALTYDRMAGLRGPQTDVAAAPGAPPSVFTAVQEQLGLKLESSRTMVETLIIDHLERPSEN